MVARDDTGQRPLNRTLQIADASRAFDRSNDAHEVFHRADGANGRTVATDHDLIVGAVIDHSMADEFTGLIGRDHERARRGPFFWEPQVDQVGIADEGRHAVTTHPQNCVAAGAAQGAP